MSQDIIKEIADSSLPPIHFTVTSVLSNEKKRLHVCPVSWECIYFLEVELESKKETQAPRGGIRPSYSKKKKIHSQRRNQHIFGGRIGGSLRGTCIHRGFSRS
jgi:hypothetical protein